MGIGPIYKGLTLLPLYPLLLVINSFEIREQEPWLNFNPRLALNDRAQLH